MEEQDKRIRAEDLIRLFRSAREERWGYIWGKRGQIWTQASQNAATREQTVKWGQKWVGKRVADCSGLFVWAFRELGSSIYHGSNTIWNKHCSRKGKMAPGVSLRPGTAVFQETNGNRSHIGLYVGGDTVIEARGTRDGVIQSSPSDWDEWGELKDVDYSETAAEPVVIPRKTIQRGSKGVLVRELQERLNTLGYNSGAADGIFGTNTREAVLAFQRAQGIGIDGIVGPVTWAALEQAESGLPMVRYTVVITGMSETEAAVITEKYPSAKVIREEGGEADG